MISGMSVNNTGIQAVLAALQNSTFNFQLTGSRYFGTHGEHSDYDFFVQDDFSSHLNGLRDFLNLEGFNHEFSADTDYSHDQFVNDVYKHYCGVHIQIVEDFELKKIAQNVLVSSGAGLHLRDKSLAKVLWSMAFTFAEKSKPESRSYVSRERALAAITGAGNHDKIQSITAYRGMTGEGLKESKEAVETIYWFKK
jgi:ribosomal protein L7/L12